MTKRERELERILILRTLMQYEPMPALRLADIASSECDHDALDALPEISRRGIGQRLNAMSLDGLVTGEPQRSNRLSERVMLWSTTEKGRALAGTISSHPGAVEIGPVHGLFANHPDEFYSCPRCPEIAAIYPGAGVPTCAGGVILGTAHEPTQMEHVRVMVSSPSGGERR